MYRSNIMTDWINWKTDGMIEKDKIDKEMEYFKQQIISALYRNGLLRLSDHDESLLRASNPHRTMADHDNDALMENPKLWDELGVGL